MGAPYANTISGLLKKRSELMGNALRLREELAHVGNDIEALDRTLISLGFEGDLKKFNLAAIGSCFLRGTSCDVFF